MSEQTVVAAPIGDRWLIVNQHGARDAFAVGYRITATEATPIFSPGLQRGEVAVRTVPISNGLCHYVLPNGQVSSDIDTVLAAARSR